MGVSVSISPVFEVIDHPSGSQPSVTPSQPSKPSLSVTASLASALAGAPATALGLNLLLATPAATRRLAMTPLEVSTFCRVTPLASCLFSSTRHLGDFTLMPVLPREAMVCNFTELGSKVTCCAWAERTAAPAKHAATSRFLIIGIIAFNGFIDNIAVSRIGFGCVKISAKIIK